MIIVEDPGQDRNYSTSANVSAGKFRIISADGTPIFETEVQAINTSAALELANLLEDQINGSSSDDSCVVRTVYVEEPALHLSTVEMGSALVVPSGEDVLVNGIMNVAQENLITARMYDTDVIERTGKRIPVRPATVVATGRGAWQNTWEYTLDTAGLEPGEYLVEVGWNRSHVSGQNAFILMVTGNESIMDKMLKSYVETPKFFGCVLTSRVAVASPAPLMRRVPPLTPASRRLRDRHSYGPHASRPPDWPPPLPGERQ